MALVFTDAQTLQSLCPIISPLNLVFVGASSVSDINWTKDGDPTGTTYNLTDFPPRYAMDNMGHLITKPDSTSPDTVWYLNFRLPSAYKIECFAIIGHNFDEISGGVDIELQVASDSAFTDDSILYSSTAYTSKLRAANFIPTTIIASGALYGRLRLEANANFVPEIGELWIGEIINFDTLPVGAFDDRKRLTNKESQVSLSGVATSYSTRYLGSEWDFIFETGLDTSREALREAFIDSEGFKKLVLLWPDPDYPSDVYMVTGPQQLNIPLQGPLLRSTDGYTFSESYPFRRAEGTLEAEDAGLY